MRTRYRYKVTTADGKVTWGWQSEEDLETVVKVLNKRYPENISVYVEEEEPDEDDLGEVVCTLVT